MQQMGVFEDAVQPSYDGGPRMSLDPASAGSVGYGSDVLAPTAFGGGGSATSQHRGESRTRGGPQRPQVPTANDPLHTKVSFFANHNFFGDPVSLFDGISNLFGGWKPGRRGGGSGGISG